MSNIQCNNLRKLILKDGNDEICLTGYLTPNNPIQCPSCRNEVCKFEIMNISKDSRFNGICSETYEGPTFDEMYRTVNKNWENIEHKKVKYPTKSINTRINHLDHSNQGDHMSSISSNILTKSYDEIYMDGGCISDMSSFIQNEMYQPNNPHFLIKTVYPVNHSPSICTNPNPTYCTSENFNHPPAIPNNSQLLNNSSDRSWCYQNDFSENNFNSPQIPALSNRSGHTHNFSHSYSPSKTPQINLPFTSVLNPTRMNVQNLQNSVLMKKQHSGSATKNTSPKTSKVKKPLNSFMIFMRENRNKLSQNYKISESAVVNQIVAKKWNNMTQQQKDVYKQMAEEEKKEHAKKYPEFQLGNQREFIPQSDLLGKSLVKKKSRCKKKCSTTYGSDNLNLWCDICIGKRRVVQFAKVVEKHNKSKPTPSEENVSSEPANVN